MENLYIILILAAPYLIYLIVLGIKELLDLLINKKSIDELIYQADNLSFEKLENDIEEYTKKLVSDKPWTKEHIEVLIKKKELDAKSRKLYYKRDRDAVYLEIQDLDKSLKEYEKEYWILKFGRLKTKYELNREINLRKVFTPE
jgi:hypothetical protein